LAELAVLCPYGNPGLQCFSVSMPAASDEQKEAAQLGRFQLNHR
jgi:hypothetical protein